MSTVEKKHASSGDTKTRPPRMWHIVHPEDEDRSLCGRKLTGEATVSDATPNECVVCADLAPRYYP